VAPVGHGFKPFGVPNGNVSADWEPETVFDILGDEEARQILAAANVKPLSARDLAEGLDVSEATVYRRVTACTEYDLLTEGVQVDDDGNHYNVYETNLKRACFEIDGGGYDVNIELRQDLVDQFDDFWGGLGGEDG
jgi:DNA-binding transcriptional ArsR family regulator